MGDEISIYTGLCRSLGVALDLLYPRKCLACKCQTDSAQNSLCGQCWSKLVFIVGASCRRCGKLLEYEQMPCICKHELRKMHVKQMIAVLQYNDMAMQMIARFKYYNHTELARLFGSLLWQKVKDWVSNADIIIPVPLHPKKLKKRGYNQAALLAFELAKHARMPISADILCRAVDNKPQMGMSSYQRINNVRNIFDIAKGYHYPFLGKSVVLVDDVITTGATCNEAGRTLRVQGGAAEVMVVSLART